MTDFVKKVSEKIPKLSTEQVGMLLNSLRSENDTLVSILESLSTGLIIVDNDWHTILVNKAAERNIPLSVRARDKNETIPIWELIDDTSIADFLKKSAEKQNTNTGEEFSIANDDKVKFVMLSLIPLVTGETIGGTIISVNDITERRKQEILIHRMESLASLTNLAASVAHEIKNPLGAISIHIQLLQKAIKKSRETDGMLPDEKFMEKYLSVVNEEIDNLNKIVLDFLFAVRPVQTNLELLEPDSIIEKTMDFFMPEFESKSIKTDVNLCKNSPRLLIDQKLLREVLVNLVQNALAAMVSRYQNNSGGKLVVRSLVKSEKYILTVADNGTGMDEKTSERIFEPYYTTKADGTGLGLTMVYKIIKEFRGDINVKSVEGKGTVFTISIPVPQSGTMLLSSGGESDKK